MIYPFLPSVLFIWIGFLIYHFAISHQQLTMFFWVMMAIFSLLLFVADIIASSYFVKRFGGSKWGERSAAVAVIVGSFIIPPFGMIVLPIIVVILVELWQKQTLKNAIRASIGSMIGFLSGVFAKIIIQLIMIIWFLITVIW